MSRPQLIGRGVLVSSASLCVLCCLATVPAHADVTPAVSPTSDLSSPAGDLPTSIQYPDANFQGASAVLPDGRFITPAGRTEQVEQEPQSVLMSHDGKRLYVSSEAYEDVPNGNGQRFFTVVDTATMAKVNVEDDALSQGLAESSDGSTLYVDEGQTDSLGVFHRSADPNGGVGSFTKTADYPLAASGAKAVDYPWGLALSPDGTKAYVTGYAGDSLITVDTASGSVLSRATTGAYPYDVVVSPDGKTGYVSNWGIYNSDAALGYSSPIDPPPITYGGSYDTTNSDSVWAFSLPADGSAPTVLTATRIGHDIDGADVDGGSSPSSIALSPDATKLAVTSSNDDEVQLLDVTRTTPSTAVPSTSAPTVPQYPTSTIDLRALVGSVAVPSPTGSQPNAVAWSSDGKALFVAEGERNDVAVVDPSKVVADSSLTSTENDATGGAAGSAPGANRDAITGRVPTAWYPGALAVNPSDSDLWVGDVRGFGTGPTTSLTDPDIKDRQTGAVQDIPISSACAALPSLTATSDRDNGLTTTTAASGANGDGSVVPATYGSGASRQIKHVFLIIKENKTFDEELGDLGSKAETDPALTTYGANITPNLHSAQSQYAISDNYYATIETSTQGHNAIDGGQVNEFVDKVTPTSYIGKFPYGSYDTLPENLPEGGFIWDNSGRNGVQTTVYGEGEYVTGVGPSSVGKVSTGTPAGQIPAGVQQDGFVTFDAAYPTQVDLTNVAPAEQGVVNAAGYHYNDEGRASEFASAVGQGLVSSLNVMILFDDHTAGDLPGANSPEDNIAENDHALGEVLDTITHSSYWPSSAVFVTEDDTQGGEDHVDQHRDIALVASPYVKQGYVSHAHTSFSSLDKTIDLILGLPPTSLQEMTSTSMADMFTSTPAATNTYSTKPETVYQYNNPSPLASPNPTLARAAVLSEQAPRQIDRGGPLFDQALALDRIGEAQAGDPNVTSYPGTVHHDLPTGDPTPVAPLADASLTSETADPAPTPPDPTAACLVSASTVPPLLPETHQPAFLAAGFALAAGGGWWARRRLARRRRATR